MATSWKHTDEDPSYVLEMLRSTPNVYAGLIAAAVGGVLALPFGLGVGLLPLLTFAAGDAIAAMFVPGSATFRHKVDTKYARRRREKIRDHLLQQLSKRKLQNTQRAGVYKRICDRINSLRKLAGDSATVIGGNDIDRLEDASVDYLGMWLALAVLEDRERSLSANELAKKIGSINEQLESADAANRQRLVRAKNELLELSQTATRLAARRTGLEAALLTLPDSIEELHHALVINPGSQDSREKLRDAVAKMHIEEDLDLAVEDELESIAPVRRMLRAKERPTVESQN